MSEPIHGGIQIWNAINKLDRQEKKNPTVTRNGKKKKAHQLTQIPEALSSDPGVRRYRLPGRAMRTEKEDIRARVIPGDLCAEKSCQCRV